MQLLLEDNQEISVVEPALAQGGEGAIFAVEGRDNVLAKVYHQPKQDHAAKLAAMLAVSPQIPADGRHVAQAWPSACLRDPDGTVVGYLMPHVRQALALGEVFNPSARRRKCPLFHHGYLLRVARNLAAAVRGVHEAGLVIGDLNESNVLVTSQALVTLVDVDSFQVRTADHVFPCRVGKPEYTPPELIGPFYADLDRLPEHDAFALAVLIFQLLMQGIHPFAGVYVDADEPPAIPQRIADGHWAYGWERSGPVQPAPYAPPWTVLPPAIQDLIWRCFDEGHHCPGARPTAADWQQALEECETQLTPCAINEQHVFARGLDVCPWCLLDHQHGHDPFPSREELQRRRSRARALRETIRSSKEVRATRVEPPIIREDPDPPLLAELAPSQSSWLEEVLCRVGAAFDGPPWLLWLAVASLASLVGVFWALEMHWRMKP